jgi:hypothetical protein
MAIRLIELNKLAGMNFEATPSNVSETSEREAELQMLKLMERERSNLVEKFGKPIDVPPVPDEFTPEKLKYWESLYLRPHYLPDEAMTPDKNFPGWLKKLDAHFYDLIKEHRINPDSAKLPGQWVLADERPGFGNPDSHDPIAAILPGQTRYEMNWQELHDPKLKAQMAEILKVEPDQVTLPRAIEFNTLGNFYHYDWGRKEEWTMLDDVTYDGVPLVAGNSFHGGLSHVGFGRVNARRGWTGGESVFRLLIRFPEKKPETKE